MDKQETIEEKAPLTSKEKAQRQLLQAVSFVAGHRFVLLFIILGAAVGFALMRTQSFIDIPRNEQRYTEETAVIRYKQIDKEALEKFQNQQQDEEVEVSSQFDPDRDNPFTD